MLNKVINEKRFFAFITSDRELSTGCHENLIKFELKSCVTDCRVCTIVKRLCLEVDELLAVFSVCRLFIYT